MIDVPYFLVPAQSLRPRNAWLRIPPDSLKKTRDNAALGVVILCRGGAHASSIPARVFWISILFSNPGTSLAMSGISQDFELFLRPATNADIDALMALRKATMLSHLQRAGAPSDDAALLARVTYRLEDARLVYVNGEIAGLIKAHCEGSVWHLIQVQVAPQWQGKGLGERLVRGLLEQAAQHGCSVVLDVLFDNPAKRLYDRLGFVVESQGAMEYRMRWSPPGKA